MTHAYTIAFPEGIRSVPGHLLIPLVNQEFQWEFIDPDLRVAENAESIIHITDAPFLPRRYCATRIRIRMRSPLHPAQSYSEITFHAAYRYMLPWWRPLRLSAHGSSGSRAYILNFVRAYMSDFMSICLSNIADRLKEKVRMAQSVPHGMPPQP